MSAARPKPKTPAQYLRELHAAKAAERRRDAQLPFEEKIRIVLELQEASALFSEAIKK